MNKAEKLMVGKLMKAFKTGKCAACPVKHAAEAAISAAMSSLAEDLK